MIEICKGPIYLLAEYISYLSCNFEEVFELCVRSYHNIVVSWLFWGFAHNCSCLVQSSFLGHDTPSTCVFLNVRPKLAKAGGHLDVKRDYVVESGSHQVVAMWPKFTSSIV